MAADTDTERVRFLYTWQGQGECGPYKMGERADLPVTLARMLIDAGYAEQDMMLPASWETH